MKECVEIYIRAGGVEMRAPVSGKTEWIEHPVTELGERITRFCHPVKPASQELVFFLAEELLFFKKFVLPGKTADIKEAVGYQLTMLTPFEGEMLHSYVARGGKQEHWVALYALPAEKVLPWLEEIAGQGFHLLGLFPESQRYVTRQNKNSKWSLLLPGRFPSLLLFAENGIRDRVLCYSPPSHGQLTTLDPGEQIYAREQGEGQSGFLDAETLLAQAPLLRQFNLLPASLRRPDYFRYLLIGLCVLNCLALLVVGGLKERRVLAELRSTEKQISELRPQVKQVEELRLKEKRLGEALALMEGVGPAFDIIGFFDKVTSSLPKTSYLDQVRMDEKTGDIQLQGYTEDIAELTGHLDELNQAKLKSTSRRKNQTYFHVEISSK